MANEIWKDIPGYEGLYQVSNLGEIKSITRHAKKWDGIRLVNEKILKLQNCRDYKCIMLSKNNISKSYLVHRLVYEAFNGPIPEGYEINHINELKNDNRLENLNLMTSKQNSNWGTRNKRITNKLSKPVLQLTLDDVLVKEWPSASECGRNGFNLSNVVACCNKKQKYHKGFIFKYKEAC